MYTYVRLSICVSMTLSVCVFVCEFYRCMLWCRFPPNAYPPISWQVGWQVCPGRCLADACQLPGLLTGLPVSNSLQLECRKRQKHYVFSSLQLSSWRELETVRPASNLPGTCQRFRLQPASDFVSNSPTKQIDVFGGNRRHKGGVCQPGRASPPSGPGSARDSSISRPFEVAFSHI